MGLRWDVEICLFLFKMNKKKGARKGEERKSLRPCKVRTVVQQRGSAAWYRIKTQDRGTWRNKHGSRKAGSLLRVEKGA